MGGSRSHSERVLGEIAMILDGDLLESVSGYITTIGPGSFTGLRIATATLKGFCLALDRPLETVSAAEARALAWLAQAPSRPSQMHVYTHIAIGKFALAAFDTQRDGTVTLREEQLIEEGEVPALDGIRLSDGRPCVPGAIIFPLKARYLGQHLRQARSRTTLKSLEEWISLSPQYLGSRF